MGPGLDTVRVLGPVEIVRAQGAVIELPSASQRRLLAALALHAPAPVRAEWLCGILDVSPGSLRTSISRVRRVLGGGELQTTAVDTGSMLRSMPHSRASRSTLRTETRTCSHAPSLDGSVPRSRSSRTSRGQWPMPRVSPSCDPRRWRTWPTR